MDRGFKWLATGLPVWLPLPPVWAASIARRRAFEAVRTYEIAMEKAANGQDPGQDWQDLENIGPVLTQRQKVYREHNFSIDERAALDLSLLWAMNANANVLVFWMLNHIYADKTLLAMLREEIAPHVQAIQPKQLFGIPEPARIDKFDVGALADECPLLKSCYIESLRLDAAPWSFRIMQEDLVLPTSREKDAEKFVLKKGTYAHIAHSMHHTNPAHFADPHSWVADRHIKREQGDGKQAETATAELDTIRAYGKSRNDSGHRCSKTDRRHRRRTQYVQIPFDYSC